jgi:hypothetical protein
MFNNTDKLQQNYFCHGINDLHVLLFIGLHSKENLSPLEWRLLEFVQFVVVLLRSIMKQD